VATGERWSSKAVTGGVAQDRLGSLRGSCRVDQHREALLALGGDRLGDELLPCRLPAPVRHGQDHVDPRLPRRLPRLLGGRRWRALGCAAARALLPLGIASLKVELRQPHPEGHRGPFEGIALGTLLGHILA
jgi:hypothetical protein